MEKKMDEMENVGKFMMTNLGSLLRAMEGLKKEVADLGEWIREEIRDRNTERDESERDAEESRGDDHCGQTHRDGGGARGTSGGFLYIPS